PRATIHLPNGRTFTIRARGNGRGRPYIQSASLDGTPLTRATIAHGDLIKGGTLTFVMGATPETTWAARPGDEPPSRMDGPRVLAAPALTGGAARFRGTQTVRLTSAEPTARIAWSLRDGETTLASGAGPEVTMDRTATLHWHAEAPGLLPSPEEQVTFRRIADARRMTSLTPPHRAYTGGGEDALLDGERGGEDFRLPTWMGFYGTDVDAVVDLGGERTLDHAAMGFLQDQNSWIFMPRAVRYETSRDGVTWQPAGEAANDVDEHTDGVVIRDFAVRFTPRRARLLRVHVTAPIMCPDWHKGAGNRSFVFADEIVWE
ncbi:MAG: hypothetical protein RL760_484, partial [Candidatus Eisenbacteria bacterium]